MQLGVVARKVFYELDILAPMGGEIFYVVGILLGLIMWGFGLLWLWFAAASFAKGKFPFNLGWWAFVFPTGEFRPVPLGFSVVADLLHRRLRDGHDAVREGVGVQVLRRARHRALCVRGAAVADGVLPDGVEVDHEGDIQDVGSKKQNRTNQKGKGKGKGHSMYRRSGKGYIYPALCI